MLTARSLHAPCSRHLAEVSACRSAGLSVGLAAVCASANSDIWDQVLRQADAARRRGQSLSSSLHCRRMPSMPSRCVCRTLVPRQTSALPSMPRYPHCLAPPRLLSPITCPLLLASSPQAETYTVGGHEYCGGFLNIDIWKLVAIPLMEPGNVVVGAFHQNAWTLHSRPCVVQNMTMRARSWCVRLLGSSGDEYRGRAAASRG